MMRMKSYNPRYKIIRYPIHHAGATLGFEYRISKDDGKFWETKSKKELDEMRKLFKREAEIESEINTLTANSESDAQIKESLNELEFEFGEIDEKLSNMGMFSDPLIGNNGEPVQDDGYNDYIYEQEKDRRMGR